MKSLLVLDGLEVQSESSRVTTYQDPILVYTVISSLSSSTHAENGRIYVFADHPTIVRLCVVVHRKTSLMSSSLSSAEPNMSCPSYLDK